MVEEWKEIPTLEGYEASNLGRIRDSLGIVIQKKNSNGRFWMIDLAKRRRRPVSQLVLHAFIGRKPEGSTGIKHLDGKTLNNHLDNLSW